MLFPVGVEIYNADCGGVIARGSLYTEGEINSALAGRVVSVLWDDDGSSDLAAMLADIPSTLFEEERLLEVVAHDPAVEDWRVGEALAEAYLVDHCSCEFPWPTGRDLKNPNSSPAGTDLVGFEHEESGVRFAFGEVKTSPQPKWPPDVTKGRHGIKGQLESLYPSSGIKSNLIRYLALHAAGTSWLATFLAASARYFTDPNDISLYGILIRDVEPKKQDLDVRAKGFAKNRPGGTAVQLRALYLPSKFLKSLPDRALQARGERS